MAHQVTGLLLIAVIYAILKYVNSTDTPKIKNLPEIPGVPLFGNLLQFGSSHAKVAGELAKKYGPVFQVRLGNRVCVTMLDNVE
jgi:phenylacetate 2-hydroxylase